MGIKKRMSERQCMRFADSFVMLQCSFVVFFFHLFFSAFFVAYIRMDEHNRNKKKKRKNKESASVFFIFACSKSCVYYGPILLLLILLLWFVHFSHAIPFGCWMVWCASWCYSNCFEPLSVFVTLSMCVAASLFRAPRSAQVRIRNLFIVFLLLVFILHSILGNASSNIRTF